MQFLMEIPFKVSMRHWDYSTYFLEERNNIHFVLFNPITSVL